MITTENAIEIIENHGGIIRYSEALDEGISSKTFYDMRDQGIIIRMSRGLYRLANSSPPGNPDLITVAMRLSKAVICLISALDYYNLTEQIPHFIYIALPQGSEEPRFKHPPLQIIWPSKKIYEVGIQEVILDNTPVKIYDPEKTITDCFKYRNKFGLDVAIDAIQRYFEQPTKKQNLNALMKYAKLNRVEKIITPYIETLL
jgi:predicted transcriptional regulator of viral defense system